MNLVDYTVRNIEVGDEEDIRVLELTDAEIDEFPEAVRHKIRGMIRFAANTWPMWQSTQDRIRALLLPYISRPDLHASNQDAWHDYVLGDD